MKRNKMLFEDDYRDDYEKEEYYGSRYDDGEYEYEDEDESDDGERVASDDVITKVIPLGGTSEEPEE